MKRFSITTLLILLIAFVNAQNTDGGATELLNKVSQKYQAFTSLQFHYTLVTTKDTKTLGSTQGDFYLKGNKYHTSYQGQSFYCDGVTLWNYQKSTNEVSIFEYDPEDDDNMMNPRLLLKNWDKHFRAKFIRNEISNNQSVAIIDLTPKYNQSYYRIRLLINQRREHVARFMDSEREWHQLTEERY